MDVFDSPGDERGKFKLIKCIKGISGATQENEYAILLCLDRVQVSAYRNTLSEKLVFKKRIFIGSSWSWSEWEDM